MTAHSNQDLQRALKGGNLEPLYLLFGAEGYLRDIAVKQIAAAALKDAAIPEFNQTVISLESGAAGRVISVAGQLPMMAARRVVRVTDFGKLKEDDEEVLLAYLKRPAPTAVVVFVSDELDKRRKLTKSLLQTCYTIEFAALTDQDLVNWSKQYLLELKAKADQRTISHIVALVGSNVRLLKLELEKLATSAIDTGEISMTLVDDLIGRSRELVHFELTNQLVGGKREDALMTIRRILDDGGVPVMLVGLLASNYRRLLLVKQLMASDAPNQEVNKLVGGSFDAREKFFAAARRTDAARLRSAIKRIAAADLALKTSQATPRLQLEMLVAELAS